jgi:hypothetical protein
VSEGKDATYYGTAKTLLDGIRELEGMPPLFWSARYGREISVQDDVDTLGMRRLFHAFKAEARSIKQMFLEGEQLASAGSDPRGSSHLTGGFAPSAWHRRENHAWLVHEITRNRLCFKPGFLAAGGQGLNKANSGVQQFDGPEYIAPCMTERGRQGIVGKLRWFHPSYHDTAVFLWLFLLGTGWNLSTALAVDVSENASWYEDHPHKPDFKVLHGFKARSDRHVFALSLAKPEWHPYRIVQYMVERTGRLRNTLRHRLAEAEAAGSRTRRNEAEIYRLREAIKSPWLYHVVNKIGDVNAFSNHDSAMLNTVARTVAEDAGLLKEHPSLASVGTSVSRDAWIGYAYAKTGHTVLLAQLAAQHANARTLRHYLHRRRFRSHSENVVRRVQDAAFSEIENKVPLDPTRLRILVRNGAVTPEQERRLLDLRQRTRLGMGCLDPTHPPREIAPDHRAGSVCRVQRCVGCRHGVVFADSLGPLARARAELMHLQREIPFSAWAGSSFDVELQSIEETLGGFDAEDVEAETNSWIEKLRRGEVIVHDTYPSY